MFSPRDNITNAGVKRAATAQKPKTVVLNETPIQSAFVGGKGTIWIRDDAPNVLIFTDDTGTDWVLNTASPPTSTLSAVLTAGNDATNLDITKLGSLTFDESDPQGINIGTDTGGAVTVLSNQIAIGKNTNAGDGGSNMVIGTGAIVQPSANQAIAIGPGASINSSDSIAIGVDATIDAASDTSIAIGFEAVCAHSGAIVIGSSITSMAPNELTLGTGVTSLRTAFDTAIVAPTGGGIVLPGASIMLTVMLNGVVYQIPLFAP